MWNRRTSYKNQWTLKREAYLLAILVSIFLTLILYCATSTIETEALRLWLTFAILSIPAWLALGHHLGTAQVRGYEKGVAEKTSRKEQPIIIAPPEYTPKQLQLLAPSVTHYQEPVDAST